MEDVLFSNTVRYRMEKEAPARLKSFAVTLSLVPGFRFGDTASQLHELNVMGLVGLHSVWGQGPTLTSQRQMSVVMGMSSTGKAVSIMACVTLVFSKPCSPPPTRGSGKERIWGKWTCSERFFGATPHLLLSGHQQFSSQVSSGSSVHSQTLPGHASSPVLYSQDSKHRSAAVALPSRDSQASALAWDGTRDQEEMPGKVLVCAF
uniref:Ac1-290 n=1 Tax=Rattus norvegicus TaxID=10116 RepID=Q7TPL0_RAT|nr:Ac1-290 [Rattus norvegicus]